MKELELQPSSILTEQFFAFGTNLSKCCQLRANRSRTQVCIYKNEGATASATTLTEQFGTFGTNLSKFWASSLIAVQHI